jgi:hypothetical protein
MVLPLLLVGVPSSMRAEVGKADCANNRVAVVRRAENNAEYQRIARMPVICNVMRDLAYLAIHLGLRSRAIVVGRKLNDGVWIPITRMDGAAVMCVGIPCHAASMNASNLATQGFAGYAKLPSYCSATAGMR